LKLTITLNLDVGNELLAEAVRKALKPDDVEVPEDIELRGDVVGPSITYELNAEFKDTSRLYTVCNIVNDIVDHVSLALTAIRSSMRT